MSVPIAVRRPHNTDISESARRGAAGEVCKVTRVKFELNALARGVCYTHPSSNGESHRGSKRNRKEGCSHSQAAASGQEGRSNEEAAGRRAQGGSDTQAKGRGEESVRNAPREVGNLISPD